MNRLSKTLLIILTLFLISISWYIFRLQAETSQTITIASWNIRIFSDNSRDPQELKMICNILKRYDLISIMELRDEDVLKRAQNILLKQMGRDYQYEISDPVGRNVKELYAFLYDSSKIYVVKSGKVFPDPDDQFIREPYYATLKAGNFDFTIISVHIIWGDYVSERQAEIQKLADVFMEIQDSDPNEQDIILAGDFNRDPNDQEAFGEIESISSMIHIFDLPEKSMIKDTHLYDNMFFQSDYLIEYTGNHGIYKFDEIEFDNDDETASLMVSDHRPIWAEFKVDGMDDDYLEITTSTSSVTTTTTSITTTSIPTTTTIIITTTIPEQPCLIEFIYGEDSPEIEILRYYRDGILSQTPEGQALIKLYYQWSPMIVEAMEEDEEFREDVKEMIDEVLTLLK